MERTVIAFEFAYGPRMRALGLVIALLLVQACAPTLSADLPIARSTAPSAGEDTALGREFRMGLSPLRDLVATCAPGRRRSRLIAPWHRH